MPFGPKITHFGIANADGRLPSDFDTNEQGIPIYTRLSPSGFQIVVEARRGTSNGLVGTVTFDSDEGDPQVRPDLQILVNRKLGDGSAAVCDRGPDPIGGIPAVPSLDFGPSQHVANAINDLSCRFDVHDRSDRACTKNSSNNDAFVSKETEVQFCTFPVVGLEMAFPDGDTMLSVQVRDTKDNIGNRKSIIIRIQ